MVHNENIALTEAVFYTLLALHKPMHGYGIMQEIEKMSSGRLSLSAGTLYGALSSMQEKGWIKDLPIQEGSRKKEYTITDRGKQIAKNELNRLQELVKNGENKIQ